MNKIVPTKEQTTKGNSDGDQPCGLRGGCSLDTRQLGQLIRMFAGIRDVFDLIDTFASLGVVDFLVGFGAESHVGRRCSCGTVPKTSLNMLWNAGFGENEAVAVDIVNSRLCETL